MGKYVREFASFCAEKHFSVCQTEKLVPGIDGWILGAVVWKAVQRKIKYNLKTLSRIYHQHGKLESGGVFR
jgi:hypothetical protein